MSFFLSGFPIPDTQDIGDSLPYLNKSLDTIDTMLALLSTGGPNFATLTSYVIQTDGSSSYFLTNYINGLPDSYIVYLDGVKQLPYTDYTISNATSSIVFSSPVPQGGLTLEVIRALALVSFAEDGTKLPLVGGTLTGNLQGPTATFTTSVSSPAIRGNLLLGTNFISGNDIFIQRGTAQLTALNLTDFGSLRLRYGTLTLDGSTISNPFGSITTQDGIFSGKIGIGTNNPGAALEANGNIWSKNASQFSGFAVRNATNTVGYIIGTSATNDNGAMGLLTGGVETVVIKASGDSVFNGGKVGIRTSTPTDVLHVAAPDGTFGTATRPANWGGGITTWDLYAGGSVGAGSATGSLSAWVNKDGNAWFGNALAVGPGARNLDHDVYVAKTKPGGIVEVKAANLSTADNTAARYTLATSIPNHYAIWETHANTNAPSVNFASGDGATTGMYFQAGNTVTNQPIVFRQGALERLRIDASGNIGIGTNTPTTGLSIVRDGPSQVNFERNSTDIAPVYLAAIKRRGTNASKVTVNNGDAVFSMQGYAYDGTADRHITAIQSEVDGAPANGSVPGRLMFSTTPAGTNQSSVERMRINSNGNVGIGTNNPGVRLSVAGNTNKILELASALNTAPSNFDGGEIISISNNTAVNGMTFSNVDSRLLTIGNTSSGGYIRSASTTIESTNNTIFTSQAVERMRITGAGNVGIGTNSPGTIFEVRRDQNSQTYQLINNANQGSSASSALNLAAYGGQWIIANGSAANNVNALTFTNSNNGELVRITASGNVGIGTSSPARKLDVAGDIQIQNLYTGVGLSTGDAAIELGSQRTGNGNAYVDFHSAAGTDYDGRLSKSAGVNGNFGLYNRGTGDLILLHEEGGVGGNIWFGTGNTERMRITPSGNVGIGTSAPGTKLEVIGSVRGSASVGSLIAQNLSGSSQATIQLYRQGAAVDQKYWEIIQYDNSNAGSLSFRCVNDSYTLSEESLFIARKATGLGVDHIRFYTNGNGERMRIDSSGNVGIGTSSPTVKLDLSNPTLNQIRVYESGNGIDTRLGSIGGTGNAGIIGTYSNHPFVINTNSTEKVRIDSSGNVGIGTTAPGRQLVVSGPSATFGIISTAAGGNTLAFDPATTALGYAQIDCSGAYALRFNTNSNERMRINSNGNIGVGTSTPTYKLDVGGNIRCSEEIIVAPTSTANQARFIQGNYGVIHRNDGSDYYILVTNSGDQYGSWNSLRPFRFNLATGAVRMDHGLTVVGSISAQSYLGISPVTAYILEVGSFIDGESTDDQSGYSVSMNAAGDRVAIGAPFNDGNGIDSGHARVYSWNGSAWIQLGTDINGEAAGDQSGYSVSMNAAGDRVAIGAPYNDGNGSNSGHVRVYSWNGSAWIQLGTDINGEAADDRSGWSVSMNAAGDRVAIGAPYNDGNGTNSGHVRVYSWNGSAWIQLGTDINGEATLDYSGSSVSMNAAGDRVAIGAPYNNNVNGSDSGHVRVYSWNGSAWIQLGTDIDGEAAGNQSGSSVSMNAAGDRVAIGAPFNDGNGSYSGHVRVYSWNGSAWIQLGTDINGEAYGDRSGSSVSMNAAGDRVAIGTRLNDGSGVNFTIYYLLNSQWVKVAQKADTGSTINQAGWSVSMNAAGDRVATADYGSGTTRMYSWSNSRGTIQLDGASLLTDPTTGFARVGVIDAYQVNTGILNVNRIPTMPASKIVSGEFPFDVTINNPYIITNNGCHGSIRLGNSSTSGNNSYAFYITKREDDNLYISEQYTGGSTATRLLITPGGSSGSFTFTGEVNVSNNLHLASTVTETLAQPTVSSSMSLNLTTGALFRISLTTSITTLTFTNVPASPRVFSFVLQLVADGTARTVAWPASVKWPDGTAPTITSTSGKVDTFSFLTYDGGTTWFGYITAQNQ